MNEACIPVVEIGSVTTAPADDPRRRHLESCPRCRALARQYRTFMDPAPLSADARVDWANAAIAQRLAHEIGTPGGVIAPLRPRPARFARSSRSLWAAAAVLLACAGIFLARDVAQDLNPRVPPGPAILRNETDTAHALSVVAATNTPGAWRIAWTAPADAEASVVVLYDAALRELGRRDLGRAFTLTLDPAVWPATAQAAYVGVVFLAGGDEVGRAAARALAAD